MQIEFKESNNLSDIDGHVMVYRNSAIITVRKSLTPAQKEEGKTTMQRYITDAGVTSGVYLWNVGDREPWKEN